MKEGASEDHEQHLLKMRSALKYLSREHEKEKSHSEDTGTYGRATLISTSRKWYRRV
jgi:hypothetical protein